MKKNVRSVGYILLTLSTIFMTFYYITEKLKYGGRWGTAMPIAMVDRFLAGKGFYYSVYEQGFESSTTYFPAGAFLSVPIRWLFGVNAENVLIAVGTIIAIVCLFVFAFIASKKKEDFLAAGWIAVIVYAMSFPKIHFYVGEIHPDIPALCFAGIALLLIESYLNNDMGRIWKLIGVVITLAVSALFKQNAVFLYAGYAIFLILSKNIKIKEKVYLLAAEFVAGVSVLAVVYLIPGCFQTTVVLNANHPKVSFAHFANNLKQVIKADYIFIFFFLVFVVCCLSGKLKLSFKEKMWMAGAVGWTVFGIYGSFKKGANNGNIEAAIVALFPFVIMTIMKMGEFFLYISKQKFKSEKVKKLLGLLAVFLVGINICRSSIAIVNSYRTFENRMQEQQQMTEWLNKNYRGSNIAILSHYYFYVCEADVEMTTDFYTTDLFCMAGMAEEDKIWKLYEKNQWDVIISMDYDRSGPRVYPSVFENYQLADDEQIPGCLKGFVYIKK